MTHELSAEATRNFLAFLEFALILAAMFGIAVAKSAAEGEPFATFVVFATYASLVPVTLCALCHGMRILLKNEN